MASLSLAAGLLISNFVGGETKIERRIERLYALDDPRFMHGLGVLPGPPILPGTKARALLNGDEIFPPMLAVLEVSDG
jgi:cardiolipin synthase